MTDSPDDLDAEADRLLGGRPPDPRERAVVLAWLQHSAGRAVDLVCPECGGPLRVTGGDGYWLVACACGETRESLRGL